MAIASPYCTKADVRLMCQELTTANVSDTNLDSIITEADKDLEVDLSGIVDLKDLKALAAIPDAMNRASVCLTRAYAYDYFYGNRPEPATRDLQKKWHDRYTEVIKGIADGKIVILSKATDESAQSMDYTVNRAASEKVFGTDDYWQYDEDDD